MKTTIIRTPKSLSLKTALFVLLVGATLALAGCQTADSGSGDHPDQQHMH